MPSISEVIVNRCSRKLKKFNGMLMNPWKVCWRSAASADFVSQGTADFAVAFKAPPTRQQLADHQLRMQEERAAELERIPDQPAADSDNESIPPPWDSRYPAWEANQLRRS